MKKTFKFGEFAIADKKIKNNEITITIELKDSEKGKTFSACGYVWNSKHTDIIMGGQCIDDLEQYLKNNKTYLTILELWQKYHLNDMHAWCECEHEENASEKIKVYKMRYNAEGKRLSKIRDLGIFKEFIEVTEQGKKNIPIALYELQESKVFNETGIEEKTRGWVTYNKILSPNGLLGKACPKCGAKYGHSWYFHAIPENDLKRIEKLFEE